MRGYLWIRNCVVSFGLAIAWLPLDSRLRIPGLGMLWRPRPCFATSPWTALYSWFYIPSCIFLVLYSRLCIPGFIFQVSYYWFYIPSFIFQDWECFGGLALLRGLALDCFIFLVLYSWLSDFTFQIPDFRFQISNSRIQIAEFRCQI